MRILSLLVAGAIAVLSATTAAQSPNRLDAPIVSQCTACDSLAEQLRKQTEVVRELERQLNEATRIERALRDAATEAAVDLRLAEKFLGQSADRAARISALDARAKATDAAWRAAMGEVNRLRSAYLAAMREWARLSSALERCNNGCGTQPDRPPDPPVNAGDPPVTPPSPPVPPPSDAPVLVPECEPCRELAIKINNLLKQRASARSVLAGIEATRASVRAEQAERAAELEKLKQRHASQRQDGSEASVQDRLDFTQEHLELLDEYQQNWEAEIKRLDAEIAPLKEQFDKCNTQCKPTTETGSLFTPRRLLVATSAVAGGLVLIGRGDDTPRTSSGPAAGPGAGTTTQPTTSQTAFEIAFLLAVGNHPEDVNLSFVCGVFTQIPPLDGSTFALAAAGPGLVSNQPATGTLNANGQAAFRLPITQPGTYTLTLTVTRNGVTRTITHIITVTGASAPCPTV